MPRVPNWLDNVAETTLEERSQGEIAERTQTMRILLGISNSANLYRIVLATMPIEPTRIDSSV